MKMSILLLLAVCACSSSAISAPAPPPPKAALITGGVVSIDHGIFKRTFTVWSYDPISAAPAILHIPLRYHSICFTNPTSALVAGTVASCTQTDSLGTAIYTTSYQQYGGTYVVASSDSAAWVVGQFQS